MKVRVILRDGGEEVVIEGKWEEVLKKADEVVVKWREKGEGLQTHGN